MKRFVFKNVIITFPNIFTESTFKGKPNGYRSQLLIHKSDKQQLYDYIKFCKNICNLDCEKQPLLNGKRVFEDYSNSDPDKQRKVSYLKDYYVINTSGTYKVRPTTFIEGSRHPCNDANEFPPGTCCNVITNVAYRTDLGKVGFYVYANGYRKNIHGHIDFTVPINYEDFEDDVKQINNVNKLIGINDD